MSNPAMDGRRTEELASLYMSVCILKRAAVKRMELGERGMMPPDLLNFERGAQQRLKQVNGLDLATALIDYGLATGRPVKV